MLLRDAHPGHISSEEYEDNLRRLRENSQAYGEDRGQGPAREGPALLQGLVLCGRCGRRMTVRYHGRKGRPRPSYVCVSESAESGGAVCQNIPGPRIEEAMGSLLLEVMTPIALEMALTVQLEVQDRIEDADRLRRTQVEGARYAAELAQRRYLKVDPDNRLVAGTLEADWNQKLRSLAEAQEEYERQHKLDEQRLSGEQRAQIIALAADFPRLWKDPSTPDRERKRLLRLVVEDVTLLRAEQITAQVRFKGGATRAIPISALDTRATDPEVVAEVDRLLDQHTRGEIAALLNERGLRPVDGQPFTLSRVGMIERYYKLKSRYQRLLDAGLLTREEMAQRLNISEKTVVRLHADGRLRGEKCDDRSHCLYYAPANAPIRTPVQDARNNLRYEVQYEA